MMRLTTYSHTLPSGQVRVFWRKGTNSAGVVDVTLAVPSSDAALIGELSAMQYLLFDKLIFDRNPLSGEGYAFKVSKGAIKKLALRKSNKDNAKPYAHFLTGRLKSAQIEVSQCKQFIPSEGDGEVEIDSITATPDLYAFTADIIETPAIGTFQLTLHAVEQYEARISSGDPKNPRNSLLKRLNNPDLVQLTPPQSVLNHKSKKYGRSDNLEFWGHRTSSFIYQIVVGPDGTKRLVTVFERPADYREVF